jgi:hypothetical protein
MNEVVLAIAHLLSFLGKCQSTLHNFRLLCSELVGKPVGETSKIVGMAYSKW